MRKIAEFFAMLMFVAVLGLTILICSPFLAIGFFIACPIQIRPSPVRGKSRTDRIL
jgi:hypothetical protein